MNRSLFIWQFDQIKSLNVPALVVSQGFNRVAVKALDGDSWMGNFDASTDSIKGIDDLDSWRVAFNRAGIAMDCWVDVTRAGLDAGVAAKYNLLATHLPGRIIFDLEPYQGFWGDQTDVSPLFDALDALNFPWAKAAISFDPRRQGWLDRFFVKAHWLMPQVYNADWIDYLHGLEIDRPCVWEPSLSVDMSVDDWQRVLRHPSLGNAMGRSGFSVWRAPLVTAEQIAAMGRLA